MNVIITIPIDNRYDIKDIVRYPIVSGIRINTTTYTDKPLKNMLKEFYDIVSPKYVWIDLKCRQLRVAKEAVIPDEYVELTHKIKLRTPAEVWFDEGQYTATIEEVSEGNKLKIKTKNNQKVKFGRGMALNIPAKYKITDGYLTERDMEYLKAMDDLGMQNILASFVQNGEDIDELFRYLPNAIIKAKIENEKGMKFVEKEFKKYRRIYGDRIGLMTARGDLYVEERFPHLILGDVDKVIEADPDAIAASRILSSLNDIKNPPYCADLFDVKSLLTSGYKTFLLGDDVCQKKESLLCALGLLKAIESTYDGNVSRFKQNNSWKEMLIKKFRGGKR